MAEEKMVKIMLNAPFAVGQEVKGPGEVEVPKSVADRLQGRMDAIKAAEDKAAEEERARHAINVGMPSSEGGTTTAEVATIVEEAVAQNNAQWEARFDALQVLLEKNGIKTDSDEPNPDGGDGKPKP